MGQSKAGTSSLAPSGAIILAGCLIALLSFGPRSAMGAFQLPILGSRPWGAENFAIGLAVQNLLWGVGQPFSGALADRFGSRSVLIAGAVLYAAGLALMGGAATPLGFDLSAGVLIGFGLSGASFNLVLGAFAKLLPPEKVSFSFGAATAAGSFGQFLFSPLAGGLIASIGWEGASLIFAALVLLIVPLSFFVASSAAPPALRVDGRSEQTVGAALLQAFGHTSYNLLVLGFFTCG